MTAILSFFGLSGAGKTTLAQHVKEKMLQVGQYCVILDGDDLRHYVGDPGFTPEGRSKQVLGATRFACLLAKANHLLPILCLVNPLQALREQSRGLAARFDCRMHHVWLDAPIEVCEKRCVHSVYKRFRRGQISGVAGLDVGFEEPPSGFCLQTLRTVSQSDLPADSL